MDETEYGDRMNEPVEAKEGSSEMIALEALDKLRNSKCEIVEQNSHGKGDRLIDKMKQSAVELYEQTRSQHPKLARRADMLVKTIEAKSSMWKIGKRTREEGSELSEGVDIDEIEVQGEGKFKNDSRRGSKRRKIKENLKEYQLNMSIESKKRLVTCLGLLKLANKQLSQRVMSLQDMVRKEEELRMVRRQLTSKTLRKIENKVTQDDQKEEEEEPEEQFYDASSSMKGGREDYAEEEEESDPRAAEIRLEVVGTLKKVYTVVSKFTGNSLPEPARSQVRETLLKLPTKWMVQSNEKGSKAISSNGRALLLAKESLEMVGNVMNVVDGTLGKAEEWVKSKQELKQVLMEQLRHEQLKNQVKQQLAKENEDSSPNSKLISR